MHDLEGDADAIYDAVVACVRGQGAALRGEV
jgi:hypothetical protein